jgi:hypothetical protein
MTKSPVTARSATAIGILGPAEIAVGFCLASPCGLAANGGRPLDQWSRQPQPRLPQPHLRKPSSSKRWWGQ